MSTVTETKEKRPADLYIFEASTEQGQPSNIAGKVYLHRKGKGFTILLGGKRYAAFPPKPKTEAGRHSRHR